MSTLIEVRSPIRGEILKTYRRPAEDEISATMKRAREAFTQWSQTPINERSRCVNSLRNLIVQKVDEIARDISEATGKTQTEAVLTELIPTPEIMKYYEKRRCPFCATSGGKQHGPSCILPPSSNTTRWGLFLF